MRKFALTAAIGAACLGLAACGGGGEAGNNTADNAAEGGDGGDTAGTGDGNAAGSASGGTAAAGGGGDWKGARIVEEGGKTYRVNADGTRVALGDGEWRIVTENGVRYRVDSGGTRVKINEQGLDIDIDTPDLTPDLPSDVDVGINKKGNLDVDVNDGDRDEKKQ